MGFKYQWSRKSRSRGCSRGSRTGKRRKLLKTVPSGATVLRTILVKILAGRVTEETTVMIDSGATNNFINQSVVNQHHIPTEPRKFIMSVRDITERNLGSVD